MDSRYDFKRTLDKNAEIMKKNTLTAAQEILFYIYVIYMNILTNIFLLLQLNIKLYINWGDILSISEYAFSVDDFNNPKVFKDAEAVMVLLTRLLLLEPGTYQSHPDMGVGLISRYRYSVEGNASRLQSDIQQQIQKYLPELQGTNVTVTESNGQYLIAAEFEGILYGVSFDTKTSKIKTSTASLADL